MFEKELKVNITGESGSSKESRVSTATRETVADYHTRNTEISEELAAIDTEIKKLDEAMVAGDPSGDITKHRSEWVRRREELAVELGRNGTRIIELGKVNVVEGPFEN